ncbi:MAG: hydroxyethylthiazole kinase [Lachnospiraceae bacterium]|nr:hydroxyethylthiazole kinase [Lachnospiraceae bacterium]
MREILERVRAARPLIHNITNYVTVNDVANIVLACGGSPIMADDFEEVEDITSICAGLNINIGTLNRNTIPSMFRAGKKANELGHAVLLDPVGTGASRHRTETALSLVKEIHFDAIRGNSSEIRALAKGIGVMQEDGRMVGGGSTKGVDADAADVITEETLDAAVTFAKAFAGVTGGVIAITGTLDLVADVAQCYVIRNGRPEMGRITGTGCQLSGMATAFLAANRGNPCKAMAAAVCAMGLAGEIGWANMQPQDGNVTYRNRIIDAVYCMTGEQLEKGAKYEIR